MNVGRNEPCPCGSGKKYKKCCMLKINQRKEREKISTERMAETPPTPLNATTTSPPAESIRLCADTFIRQLETVEVESIFKLTDRALAELKIKPNFSYADIAKAIDFDERFELAKGQLCCLAGSDPIKLYVKRLGF